MAPKCPCGLLVENMSVGYGGVHALDDVGMTVQGGEILGLIGPNGAGKTTLLNAISGVGFADTVGRVLVKGVNVTHASPWRRSNLGVRRTFQNIRIFNSLSVYENVLVGLFGERRRTVVREVLRGGPAANSHEGQMVIEALARVGLQDAQDARAAELSYGEQRRLELARAIVRPPSVLLLDEPLAGMHALDRRSFLEIIVGLRGPETAIVLIEHDVAAVMATCDHVTVLHLGRVLANGVPEEVARNRYVVAAYLGKRSSSL